MGVVLLDFQTSTTQVNDRINTFASILPQEIKQELVKFWAYTIHSVVDKKLPLPKIGSCDKTPIYFGYEQKNYNCEKGCQEKSNSSIRNTRCWLQASTIDYFQRHKENTYGKLFIEVQENAWCKAKLFKFS
eukprot:TRINITY_DN11347_c0_g1_i1.p3 TRINITY_DN11347_c0_g1~~TRINITY_DN11347_c0_g1_i1.p3  ORF type:complete len:131 (-),score=2.40 TRINITY_DN11347_c0_g1_i1:14-406(-)